MIASTTSVSLESTTLRTGLAATLEPFGEMSTATANCTVDDVAVAPAARYMRTPMIV
jgi:hypothetical protein